jgi:hypothetical protein
VFGAEKRGPAAQQFIVSSFGKFFFEEYKMDTCRSIHQEPGDRRI